MFAAGCNSLTGVDGLVVAGNGGPDGTVVEEAAAPGAADGSSGGDARTDAEAGGTTGADGALDANGGEATTDATSQATVDATDDATPDAEVDAASDGARTDSCSPVTHSNGLGQAFYDCTPLGTRTLAEATAACIAYAGSAGGCVNNPPACMTGSVCSSGATMCACWRYMGPTAGHVTNPAAACACPSGMDPTWQ
jgi:iron complex outermembrane receptor protein